MAGERTGVGRYVEGLLTGLSRCDFDGEVHLFFQGARFEHALWSDPRFRLSFANASGRSAVVWEQLSLPARLAEAGLDAFLGPAYSLPPRLPCPALVALHDLSFEVLPQEFGWRELWRRRLLARSAARRASRVLTLSKAVGRQIEEASITDCGIEQEPSHLNASAFDLSLEDIVEKTWDEPDVGEHVADPDLDKVRHDEVVAFRDRL
jgi:hypothetical protein